MTPWLSDASLFASVFPVDAGTVALKVGVIYKEHLCAVALTGSRARGPYPPACLLLPWAILLILLRREQR